MPTVERYGKSDLTIHYLHHVQTRPVSSTDLRRNRDQLRRLMHFRRLELVATVATHTRIDRYIELVDGELESSQSVGVSGALPHPKTSDPLNAIVITPITRNRCFARLFTRDTIFLGDGDHRLGGDGVMERPGPYP